jgi:cyclopropane fatty-acyl-phospholipid synthase-like methyltransferase
MADRAIDKQPARRRQTLFERLRDRFRGGAAGSVEEEPQVADSGIAAATPRVQLPPPDRLTVLQWLHGPGFLIPGDATYVLEIVKPFHLSPAMTMLDMAAGLGGPARAIAESFNTYVTGYERDSALARRASDETATRGLSRHVQISAFDPESFELRTGFYDHALAREATYCVEQKERFLRVLNQAMKPFGQLILTDFVLDRAAGERPELASWVGTLRDKPHLWTAAQYSDCFKSLGFDLRIANDITADYRRLILLAWKNFLERGELRQIRGTQAAPVIDEVERGLRTVAALESGALKFYYFVALGGRRRAT